MVGGCLMNMGAAILRLLSGQVCCAPTTAQGRRDCLVKKTRNNCHASGQLPAPTSTVGILVLFRGTKEEQSIYWPADRAAGKSNARRNTTSPCCMVIIAQMC